MRRTKTGTVTVSQAWHTLDAELNDCTNVPDKSVRSGAKGVQYVFHFLVPNWARSFDFAAPNDSRKHCCGHDAGRSS